MFGVIKRNPTLPFSDLWEAFLARSVEEKGGKCSYTGYSRFALFNFLKILKLEKGSQVLLPAYICDVVPRVLSEFGLEPVYYGISDQFQIDFSTIPVPTRAKTLITVNYFGLSQDFEAIQAFVDEHGLLWINDNSHGYASCHGERKLESFGDFSFTSFRKTLPVINGARACINNDAYAFIIPEFSRLNSPQEAEHKVSRFLAVTLSGMVGYRPYVFPDYSLGLEVPDEEIMAYRLDGLSRNIFLKASEEAIQKRRYHLFQKIAEFLSEKKYPFLKPQPGLLKAGNSPMVFPVQVTSERAWKAILQASRNLGIDIHTWPILPRKVMSDDLFGSVTLWKKLLCLPVHQDLRWAPYGARLAEVFNSVRV